MCLVNQLSERIVDVLDKMAYLFSFLFEYIKILANLVKLFFHSFEQGVQNK